MKVPADIRVKANNELCAQAKFSDVTKNFLVVLADIGRLPHVDTIAKRISDLTMVHQGEVKAVVTTVIIDLSILGGLVVEFGQKVFDMSIKTRARQMERFLRDPINFDA